MASALFMLLSFGGSVVNAKDISWFFSLSAVSFLDIPQDDNNTLRKKTSTDSLVKAGIRYL
jgi:hypothetical protein